MTTSIFAGATKSVAIPLLDKGWTPQGLTALDGRLLQALYKAGANTRLVAVDPKTGKVYGQVAIAETHAGGIAAVGDWLYVQDAPTSNAETVRRYKLPAIRSALKLSHVLLGHPVYRSTDGLQQLDAWQFMSFATTDGKRLMAGHHGDGESARMYVYDVDPATGLLTQWHDFLRVPNFTDGAVAITGGYVFISHGQDGYGTLTRTDRAGMHLSAQRMPNLGEGACLIGNTVYVSFESAARGGRPSAIDKVANYWTIKA